MAKKFNSNMVDTILGGSNLITGKEISNNNIPSAEIQEKDVSYVTIRISKKLHFQMKKKALFQDQKLCELYKEVIENYLDQMD